MIEVEGLVKTYGFRRTTLAVDDVSFSVPKGARLGLLGANGSGKSTVLQILATILRPTKGTVRVGGYDVVTESAEVRRRVGYMPQDLDLRAWSSGAAYLRFWARASGLPPEVQTARINGAMETLELGAGMEGNPALFPVDVQKRLNLAQALMTEPQVLLLDDPLIGLSDVGRRFVAAHIERLAAGGTTVVLSSPLLADIRAGCDQVAVMSDGHLTRVFQIDELLAKIGQGKDARVFIEGGPLMPEAMAAVRNLKGVVEVRPAATATIVYVKPTELDMDALRRALEDHGAPDRRIREAHLTLGDVFSAFNA